MNRFASLDEENIQAILKEKDAINTQKAAQQSFNVLIKYCREKNKNLDIKAISTEDLNQLLRTFYAEVRKEDEF